MDLASVADELYSLPPAEFTARRGALAAQAKKDGDRALAGQITALRRPAVAAWLVNRLVRDRPELLAELAELGAQLRAAHRELAGDQLRELSARRQSLVRSVSQAAAADVEAPPSAAVLEQLTQTLEAALADPDAESAVRSGQLTSALFYSGFGGVDLTDAVATTVRPRHLHPVPDPPKRTAGTAQSHPPVEGRPVSTAKRRPADRVTPAEPAGKRAPAEPVLSRDELAARARRSARQRDLDRAESAAATAAATAQAALRARDDTERARRAAAATVRELEHQLVDARAALKQAEAAAGSADRSQRRAVRDAERAAQRLDAARAAVEEPMP